MGKENERNGNVSRGGSGSRPGAGRPGAANRLGSLDAYRGFVMLAMVSAGLGMGRLVNDPTWGGIADQLRHRQWEGCTFWDLIQPSFMFIVGVAMTFSFAQRSGQSGGWQILHVARRCLLLIAVGIFLDSYLSKDEQVVIQFIRVLQQIAIGYFLAFLVIHLGPVVQFAAAVLLLAGHTAAYMIYANTTGPEAWNMTNNFGRHLDELLHLPLSPGYYVTFNAVSSTATILFGVLCGHLLKGGLAPLVKVAVLALVGVLALAIGWALSGGGVIAVSFNPVIPMIKKLWTASFAIFAAGWTCLMLAAFYVVIDVLRVGWWSWIFVVVGMNSIFMYVLHELSHQEIARTLRIFLGPQLSRLDENWQPVAMAVLVLAVEWLVCLWLYLHRVFIKL